MVDDLLANDALDLLGTSNFVIITDVHQLCWAKQLVL